jgi:hypothetical protein
VEGTVVVEQDTLEAAMPEGQELAMVAMVAAVQGMVEDMVVQEDMVEAASEQEATVVGASLLDVW